MDAGTTVVTSIITAFVSTIVLQYFFAPWLEARKARKLKQAEGAADFADKLNELAGLMWDVHNYHPSEQGMNDLRLRVHNLGLLEAFQKVVLSKGNRRASRLAIIIQQLLFAVYSPEEAYLNDSVEVVRLVEKAIDPASAPWSKAAARYRARRLYKKKVGPKLTAATRNSFRDKAAQESGV